MGINNEEEGVRWKQTLRETKEREREGWKREEEEERDGRQRDKETETETQKDDKHIRVYRKSEMALSILSGYF